MVLRVAFFVLMALGLTGFGTVAWLATRPPVSRAATVAAATKPPSQELVLIAAHPIHAGSLLKPEDLATKDMPVPEIAAMDLIPDKPGTRRALVGAMARHSLGKGDTLRNTDLMRPGDHGFLAAVLQPGMRAVSIAVDNTTGSAGLIWPGDDVDLILTQTLNGPGVPAGHQVAAETVLSDIRVLAIDQQIIEGAAPTASGSQRTVTLEVTPEQAEKISVATRLGRLSLAVRSAGGSHQIAGRATGPGTTWALDVSPAIDAQAGNPTGTMHIYQGADGVKEFKF